MCVQRIKYSDKLHRRNPRPNVNLYNIIISGEEHGHTSAAQKTRFELHNL